MQFIYNYSELQFRTVPKYINRKINIKGGDCFDRGTNTSMWLRHSYKHGRIREGDM